MHFGETKPNFFIIMIHSIFYLLGAKVHADFLQFLFNNKKNRYNIIE